MLIQGTERFSSGPIDSFKIIGEVLPYILQQGGSVMLLLLIAPAIIAKTRSSPSYSSQRPMVRARLSCTIIYFMIVVISLVLSESIV